MCGALLSQGARTEYPESGMSISTVPTETGDFWLVRAQCAGLRSAGARSNVTAVVFFSKHCFFSGARPAEADFPTGPENSA
mmetsp:Transcript_59064/g.127149  ORF Transcript_59064/g.127149 Transcript_59064/m.127149 type:complete len:81 (-) Transcript_59064:200-442(-)